MRILNLKLVNIKCHKDLEIDFKSQDDTSKYKTRLRTLILGNNGTGKSTILKSIAIILGGTDSLDLIGDPNDWINNASETASIRITLQIGKNRHDTNTTEKVQLNFLKNENSTEFQERNTTALQKIDRVKNNTLIFGYGVERQVAKQDSSFYTNSEEGNYLVNVSSLFAFGIPLYSLPVWVREIHSRDGNDMLLKSTLSELLPGTTYYRFYRGNNNQEDRVEFKNSDGVVSFEALSDGFKSTANWIGDLLYKISGQYRGRKKNLKNLPFILIIDEISLHLHPRWQRMILQTLKMQFPNAQLILTTHSPFVAQQAHEGELISLYRDSESQSIKPYKFGNDPRKLLLHQIVTSRICDVPTDESFAMEIWKEGNRTKYQKELYHASIPNYENEESIIIENVKEHKLEKNFLDNIVEMEHPRAAYSGRRTQDPETI